jgi:nucleoid-associated protein YgaU
MGRFEKIVVLVALLLVTLILAVTFSSDEETAIQLSMADRDAGGATAEQGASTGLGAERSAPAEVDLSARRRETAGENGRTRRPSSAQPDEARPGTGRPAGGSSRGAMLEDLTRREREREETRRLEAERRERQAELAVPEPEVAGGVDLLLDDSHEARAPRRDPALPEGAALLTLEGLSETWEPDLKEYVWREGDTWTRLAETYYGDARQVALLRQFTEGLASPRPGAALLVPVFDNRERAAAQVTEVDPLGREVYTVQEGDSLWAIAKKSYGKGQYWERIFEANREQLPRPEDVRPGMELVIP